LVSLTASETSLVFVFGFWTCYFNVDTEQLFLGSPSTATYTLELSDPYALSTSQTQALDLLAGTTFAAMSPGTKATCSYNADGSISVVTTTLGVTASEGTTCSGGEISTPDLTASVCYAETAASANGWTWTYAKAQIEVEENYCIRTFYCNRSPAVVGCTSYTADTLTSVEMDPPSFSLGLGDEAVYSILYPGAACT
jgi:hypothetical protein